MTPSNGGAGNGDTVEGNQGDDTLDGGAGNEDVIIGGTGNDKIDGGPGEHDIADYAGVGGAVTVDLQTQTVSGAENEHLEGIEDAIGGSGADTLIGSSEPNRLDGGPGNDHLEAAAGGGDAAFGGPGSDQCTGGFADRNLLRPGGRRQWPRGRNLRVDRRQVDADPDRQSRQRPGHRRLLGRQVHGHRLRRHQRRSDQPRLQRHQHDHL